MLFNRHRHAGKCMRNEKSDWQEDDCRKWRIAATVLFAITMVAICYITREYK